MKTFTDLLKRSPGVRLVGPHNNTWLVWHGSEQVWKVFQSRKRRVVGQLIISTSDETEAIDAFARVAEIEFKEAQHG